MDATTTTGINQAGVAQLAERQSCKLLVAGSMPVTGPKTYQVISNLWVHSKNYQCAKCQEIYLVNGQYFITENWTYLPV